MTYFGGWKCPRLPAYGRLAELSGATGNSHGMGGDLGIEIVDDRGCLLVLVICRLLELLVLATVRAGLRLRGAGNVVEIRAGRRCGGVVSNRAIFRG